MRLHIGLGDYAKALTEARSALMLDPSSAQLQILFAQAMVYAGDCDQAVSVLSNLIELSPNCHIARRQRAEAFLSGGDPEKAIGDLQLLSQEADANGTDVALLSRALAEYGDADRARRTHERLLEMSSGGHVVRVSLALSAIGIGEEREAMQHLENAYRDREPALVFLNCLHWFEPLRDTPEFVQMLVNIGPKSRSIRATIDPYGLNNFDELHA